VKRFEDKWEDQDGLSFFIEGWEPEGKPKALVLLIHGLGEHVTRYAHVGSVLSDAGYALAGFDLRGHGRSGGPRGHSSSLNAYMQDIRQFHQRMEAKYSGMPHFLYGHSLGGLLALVYAIQHGAQFQGVVATGPALRSSLQEQQAKVAMVRLLGSILPSVTVYSGLDAASISRDAAVVQAYKNDALVHYSTSLGFGKAALNAIDFCFAHASEFPVPLLIMHGKADKITYASGSEEFANLVRLAGKDVTLKLWDGLYHEVHNEPEKEDVFRYMIAWLDGHL
jgi:acylglycerol lipase